MINQYKIIKTLGKGAFGLVLLCLSNDTKDYYAIKKMNKALLKKKPISKGRNAYDCVIGEMQVMQRLEHPNIIWLHEIIDDPKKDSLFLVTEYHSNGSLGDQLKELNKDRFSQDHIGLSIIKLRLYLIDILKALFYCH